MFIDVKISFSIIVTMAIAFLFQS